MDDLFKFITEFSVGFAASLALFIVVIFTMKKTSFFEKRATKSQGEDIEDQLKTIMNKLDLIEKRVETLYEWHNVTDMDGVKVWYMKRSLEFAVKNLSETIAALSDLLKDIMHSQKFITKDIRDIKQDVSKNK